jgi:hypothetical protein
MSGFFGYAFAPPSHPNITLQTKLLQEAFGRHPVVVALFRRAALPDLQEPWKIAQMRDKLRKSAWQPSYFENRVKCATQSK